MADYDILDQLQRDLYHRLLGDEFLQEVPILLQNDGDVQGDWTRAVALDNPREGQSKIGLVIIANIPRVTPSSDNTDNPSLEIELRVTIAEQVEINRNTTSGTGITFSRAMMRVMRLCSGLHLAGISNACWTIDDQAVDSFQVSIRDSRDVNVPGDIIGYSLPFRTVCYNEATRKLAAPTITQGGGFITISHGDYPSDLYYTTDGSYPGPGNPDANLYTAPFFPPAAGEAVRACCHVDETWDESDAALLIAT